ncbi:ribose-5-phosphate isomerase [Clostridium sp. JNZ J1-5]|nr:ribose-5-phosphate isomerase [Clostridium sp.]
MFRSDKYEKIIDIICSMKGIKKEDLYKILKDRECKYLLFLLLKKYNCDDMEKINRDFYINNKRVVNYNIRKAQEKFLINNEFRQVYFQVEKEIGE